MPGVVRIPVLRVGLGHMEMLLRLTKIRRPFEFQFLLLACCVCLLSVSPSLLVAWKDGVGLSLFNDSSFTPRPEGLV